MIFELAPRGEKRILHGTVDVFVVVVVDGEEDQVGLSQDVFDPEKYQWHFTPGLCGPSYALFDYGVHWLDLVQFISGQPITEY